MAIALLVVFLFSPTNRSAAAASPGKIIVSVYDARAIAGLASEYGLSHYSKLYGPGNVYEATMDTSELPILLRDSRVIYAEADEVVSAAALGVSQVITTNDPFFTTDSTAEDKQWYLPKMQVPDAWAYSKGSSNVIVAVIDTGIHASHLDLNDGRVMAGFDMTQNQPIEIGANSDDNGHGTAVAGIIGAVPNNHKGISGVDWNVSLMPVKALDAQGNGDLATISQAIVWAADHSANIINLSLGGAGFPNDITLSNAVSYAFNKGVLIVAAAGNDTAAQGLNLDSEPVYPVCEDNSQNMVLGVAASDFQDHKATFSNFGINCVDITAPGKKILTTGYLPSNPSDDILIYASGTSVATPMVAGVAALIEAEKPSITNKQLRDLILNTADNIDSINFGNCLNASCSGFLGHGRINALSAVVPQPILNNTLVQEESTSRIYLISGGTKRYVSPFVFAQRFASTPVVAETADLLANYTLGQAVAPITGTLVKGASDPTVYYIDGDYRRPLTYLVFTSRNFSFANVKVMPDTDVATIPTADWYWPPDGTLVLIKGSPTVYVMDQQVVRPVTYFVFTQRRLSFAKVIAVTDDEYSHLPHPKDNYWLAPLDATLVKSATDPTVNVIEAGTKRPISGTAFAARNYKFGNVKILPQAEIDVISPGTPIF